MDNINYKDFQNIRRTCLLTCDHKFVQDHVTSDAHYNRPGTSGNLNDKLRQQTCPKCYEKMIEIHAFSFRCKQANSSLIKCLNEYKNLQKFSYLKRKKIIQPRN